MKRQIQILQFINEFINEHQYSPTVREITEAVGLKSPSTVHGHLDRLRKKGYINFVDSSPRTISIMMSVG